jgi:thioesterase domain-containing protein/acyl carrier protein
MRFILCQRNDDCYTLVWSSHHLILDRWCISLLMNDLATLYEASRTDISARLEARRPFRDYIRWLEQQESKNAEHFWRGELAGIQQPIHLGDNTNTGTNKQVGEDKYWLDSTFSARLRSFAVEHHLTLSSVVMGAWALVHGLADPSSDFLLGVTISGRPPTLPGVEGIIGPFINNVPLRVSVPLEGSITDWLQTLQDRQLAIQTYGYVSPLQIQEWSQMPSGVAPYETLFLYQSPVKMSPLSFQMVAESATLQTNFPLTLTAADETQGLLLWFIFHQPHYSAAIVASLRDRLIHALDLLTAEPNLTPFHLLNQLRATAASSAQPVVAIPETIQPSVARQSPRNGMEARLFNLWAHVLGHQSFGVTDKLFDLGASSLQAVQLLSRIRQTFGRELPVATLFTAPTIEQLAQVLTDGAPLPAWSALVPIKPSGRKTPLFLVHHGGGGLFGYGDIARYLDADRPLYGLQEPGIENGQDLPTSVEEIASIYVREIQSLQPHGPYCIGGFCFGGVVAFEMAQQFRRAGESVEALVLLDAFAPGYIPQANFQHRFTRHQAKLAQLSLTGKLLYMARRIVRRARWEVQRRYIIGRRIFEHAIFHLLEQANKPVPSYLRQRRLLELNGHLNDIYVPKPYTGHTILIRGTYPELHYPLDFGWNTLVQPDVSVFQMETEDHLQMLAEPHIHTLIGYLQTAMNQVEGEADSVPLDNPNAPLPELASS